MFMHRGVGLLALALPWLLGAAPPSVDMTQHSFAVYTLSIGKGVPDEARAALNRVRTLLEDAQRHGVTVQVQEARIGLEGERRLCARFADARIAQDLLREVRTIGAGAPLFRIEVEDCDAH